MTRQVLLCVCFMGWSYTCPTASAGDAEAVTRGKMALETRASLRHWPADAYENAWKYWVPKLDEAPADYDKAFAAYYGLHPAPFKNGGYPMGMGPGSMGKGEPRLPGLSRRLDPWSKLPGPGQSSLDLQ